MSYFTHIFFSFFLAFLLTSYGFILIKTYKLHYFYLIVYSEATDRGEITITTMFTSGLDLCIFPCFKYIVYQINSFDFLRFSSSWCFFFVRNYLVSHHAHPSLRAPPWILNLKTLAQRFQVCYVQKCMREIWHCSFTAISSDSRPPKFEMLDINNCFWHSSAVVNSIKYTKFEFASHQYFTWTE